MKSIICKLFGHRYTQVALTFSVEIKPEGDTWHKVSQTGVFSICARCGLKPIKGDAPYIRVGSDDTYIAYNEPYSIRDFMLYTGEELTAAIL